MSTFQLYEKLKSALPSEAAEAMAHAFDEFAADLRNTVTREDFSELKATVGELAQAQQRTEQRVEELAQAQQRTEQRVDELALSMRQGFESVHRRFDVIGSRWGSEAEEAFRSGLHATVSEVGYSVERFQGNDTEGYINYTPRSYDLDILVRNGVTVAAEIKSSVSRADVTEFLRSVQLFEKQTGRTVDKRIMVGVSIHPLARELAEELAGEVILSTGFRPLGAERE